MFGKNTSAVVSELEWIEVYGFEAIAIFPLPGMGASPEKMIDLIPGFLLSRLHYFSGLIPKHG